MRRRRTEEDSGVKEDDNFTEGDRHAENNTLLVKRV